MKNLLSQIVIGVVVTVIGTVIANAIVSGGGKRHWTGSYHGVSRSAR